MKGVDPAPMPAAHPIQVRLLDDPAIVVEGDRRAVTRPREQALLARLALSAPAAVPVPVLIDDIWGEAPPTTAVDSLRVHVSSLRKLFAGPGREGTDSLVTAPGAYRLEVSRDAIDVHRLESACRGGDDQTLRDLLGPWPDQELDRFDTGSGFFSASARRIVELRAASHEVVAEADLERGRPTRVVAELETVLRHEPYRERSWVLLVEALAAAGRRTAALRAFQRASSALAEIGMTPGPALVAAERAVLAEEPAAPSHRLVSDYVDVEGSRVAFATMGHGQTDLLFLHGGFVPFDVMRDAPQLARFLDALTDHFRVVFVDRRGIGMSDPPAEGSAVTLEHWVADCRAVLDAVRSERAVLFGHENGGPVAIRLAAEMPQRVSGLVLHSTAARPLRAPDHPYGPSEDVLEWVNRMIDGLPGATDVLARVAPSARDDGALRAWLERAGRLGAAPGRARELHRAYFDADVRHVLDAVRVPAIVLEPARRVGGDPGQARYLADHLPSAELQLLDSGDHLFWLADADVVLAAIERLMAHVAASNGTPPVLLRALVAVTPPVGADLLTGHGAEVCLDLPGTLVAVFPSRSTAQAAVEALRGAHPDAVAVVELADTAATRDDRAVTDIADAARSARGDDAR